MTQFRRPPALEGLSRRRLLVRGSGLVALTTLGHVTLSHMAPAPLFGQDNDPERSAVELITPDVQRAIDHGLAFLAERQDDDGSFGSGGYSRNVAVCGLAGMA